MLNLDTFRTSGRRLRAGSDADVTDVSTVTIVTTVTPQLLSELSTRLRRYDATSCNMSRGIFSVPPQIGTERFIKE